MDQIKVYSPNQVAFGTFVGGPVAGAFVLWSNFRAVGNNVGARQTLIWGALLALLLLLVVPFLPDKLPGTGMPIVVALSLTARALADKYQLSKSAIQESEQYAFQSNWYLFGISIVMLVAFFTVFFLWVFALVSFDIIH